MRMKVKILSADLSSSFLCEFVSLALVQPATAR